MPRVTGVTETTVNLEWSPPSGTLPIDFLGYYIWRRNDSLGTAEVALNAVPLTGTALTDSGVNCGTFYTYRIRSVDTASNQSSITAEVTTQTAACPSGGGGGGDSGGKKRVSLEGDSTWVGAVFEEPFASGIDGDAEEGFVLLAQAGGTSTTTSSSSPPPDWVGYTLHTDHLGSIRLVTDAAGGIVPEHLFIGFGEEILPPKSPTSHRYTGHEWDTETNLTYMMARYYSPGLSRFLSVDPGDDTQLEDPQSWNKYAYVGNNPLGFVDETGEGKAGFLVRTAKGIWKSITSKQAQSAYRAGRDVKVRGTRASSEAQSLAKRTKGKNTPDGQRIVRHDPHRPGQDPHYQTKSGDGSHVRYEPGAAIIPGAGAGAAAGDAVEKITGSKTAGDLVQAGVDLVNPLSDIEDIIDLITGGSGGETNPSDGGSTDGTTGGGGNQCPARPGQPPVRPPMRPPSEWPGRLAPEHG